MNNRYLYRAKRTDNGEWIIGYHAVIGKREVIIEKEPEDFYSIENAKNAHGNKIVDVDPSTICQSTGFHDETKWEQLTKDEQQKFLTKWNYEKDRFNQKEDWNGKLIWENDIVEIENFGGTSYKYLIWWNREMNLMDSVPLDGIAFNGHDYWNGHYPNFHYETFCTMMQDPWGDFSYIKVISNIFDNPELLEK